MTKKINKVDVNKYNEFHEKHAEADLQAQFKKLTSLKDEVERQLIKYQDKVKRMTECLKNCKDVFNAVGPELLGTDNITLIQGVASAQNWVQRILDEPEVK